MLAQSPAVLSGAVALGDNARAALITRGLAEMVRLAIALGGKPATLMGLSGMGDLVLTCTAMQSRNLLAGGGAGRGSKPERDSGSSQIGCRRRDDGDGSLSVGNAAQCRDADFRERPGHSPPRRRHPTTR